MQENKNPQNSRPEAARKGRIAAAIALVGAVAAGALGLRASTGEADAAYSPAPVTQSTEVATQPANDAERAKQAAARIEAALNGPDHKTAIPVKILNGDIVVKTVSSDGTEQTTSYKNPLLLTMDGAESGHDASLENTWFGTLEKSADNQIALHTDVYIGMDAGQSFRPGDGDPQVPYFTNYGIYATTESGEPQLFAYDMSGNDPGFVVGAERHE
jgi:hypothetical protein